MDPVRELVPQRLGGVRVCVVAAQQSPDQLPDQVAINVDRRNRSFTVAFAAYNETGYESLTHVLPDRATGWQQGTLRQTYSWTVTVNE
ncbi:hypothetical protein [Streptomyces sp. NPDC001536]|uniref:hypothetical protein n=1 Tax=Streptomyces sp. NPDC001536 TaxID=3364583 RepID=UPI0036BB4B98